MSKPLSIWPYARTFLFLAYRSIVQFTRGSLLGVFWSVMLPLLHGLTTLWVFSELFRMPGKDLLFVMWPALFTWQFFVKTTTQLCTSLSGENVKLSTLPNLYFTLSHIFNDLFSFLVMISVVVIAYVVTAQTLPIAFLLNLFPAFCVVLLFTMGVGLVLSALYVFLRDTQYLWNVLCQMGVFLSPVYVPEQFLIESRFWPILQYNPMFYLLRLIREPLVSGDAVSLSTWAISIGISLVTAAFGVWFYQRCSKYFLNFI